MFELIRYRCPDCGAEVRDQLSDGQVYACYTCRGQYRILLDDNTERAGFVPLQDVPDIEPLHLPKGSIRALATLLLAGCCWFLIAVARPVPAWLLSLLLTVIGYYFGFRKKYATSQSRIYDASARSLSPLFLPGGVIRLVLILGFAASTLILLLQNRMADPAFLEFFLILAGLILGYAWARVSGRLPRAAVILLGHIKGIIVLAAVVVLALLLLSRMPPQIPELPLVLACIVSFYFGSRS